MNPDTADPAIRAVRDSAIDGASELAVTLRAGAAQPLERGWAGARAEPFSVPATWLARLRADPARMRAVRESWRAMWSSRLLVWAAGVTTVASVGFGPARHALNPLGLTRGLGSLGNLLAAPAARWDSAW
jgi:hypothetical protein